MQTEKLLAVMKEVIISDAKLQQAAESGPDAFLATVIDATLEAIGGELNADNMNELSADQVTLLAFHMLHEEVMDGGFVQLIHNGYGPFFFQNPFAKAMLMWDIAELAKLMNKVKKLYLSCHEDLERDCSEDEFMALFEQHPEFDDCDDAFVENEEQWAAAVAYYVDEHLDNFCTVRS